MGWNFFAQTKMPTLDQRTASEVGGEIGQGFGAIGKFASNVIDSKKSNELIAKYNDAGNQDIFGGLKGSARTAKLAMLLRPVDSAAADKYYTQSENEKKAEGMKSESDLDRASKETIRREELASKTQEKADLESKKAIANTQYNEAVKTWSNNPDGKAEQDELLSTLSNARMYGLNLINPITNWTQKQQFASNTDLKKLAMESDEAQNEFNRVMAEKRLDIDYQKLGLDRQKMAQDSISKGDKRLDSTSIDKMANLSTVLESTKEIRDLIDQMKRDGFSVDLATDLRSAVEIASENLGRTQSGGAIQADELKSFKGFLEPNVLDLRNGGESWKKRLSRLESMIGNKMNAFKTGGKSLFENKGNEKQPIINPSKSKGELE